MKSKVCILLYIILIKSTFLLYSNNIDSLIIEIKKNPNDTSTILYTISLIKSQFKSDSYKAMDYANQLYIICEQNNFIKGVVEINLIIGNIHLYQGRYDDAIQILLKNLEICDQYNLFEVKAKTQTNMGNVYLRIKNYTKALELYQVSLEYFLKTNNFQAIQNIYGNIGIVYSYKGEYSKSIDFHNKAIDYAIKAGDTIGIALEYNNISVCLRDLKKYDEAKEYLYKAIEINKKINNIKSLIFQYNNLALISIYKKEYIEAKEFLDTVEFYVNSSGFVSYDYYENLITLDTSKNDFKSAFYKLSDYKFFCDSLLNEEQIAKIAEMETKYKVEIKDKENKLQKAIISRQNLYIITLIIIVLLFITIVCILINNHFKAKKTNKKIREQQEIIHQNELHIFKQQIEYQQKELTTNALLLIEANEKISKIIDEIQENLPILSADKSLKLQNILNKYKNTKNDQFWEEFETRFEKIHTDFYKNLLEKFPSLTQAELKLCAFLRLNMTTKDIASITFTTEGGINVTRSRIRAKLGLNRDENLVKFLNQF